MKKIYLAPLFAAITVLALSNFTARDPNGKAGYTGSPGENACNNSGCHTTYGINTGAGSIEFTSDIPATGYVPNTTYNMHIKVKYATRTLFGLAFEALTSTNTNAGTFTITEATKTQIKARTVNGVSRNSVTHKQNGGAAQDSVIFSFKWKAPASGPVHFYYAGLAANANGNDTGDYVYKGDQAITQEGVLASHEANDISGIEVFPNPVTDRINLRYSLDAGTDVHLNLRSLDGRLVKTLAQGRRTGGLHEEQFPIKGVARGAVYFVEIKTTNGSKMQKIVAM